MSHVKSPPPTQNLRKIVKKAQKYKYLTGGLMKIIGVKNKKLQNSVSVFFYIHVTREKSTTYAKFGKNSKNAQFWTPRATGLS